jgi:hypothetical protein
MTFKISKNEGNMDRLIRVLIAIALALFAYFWLGGIWQIVFYIISGISLFTAITGFCTLYKILGINTCRI